MAVLCPQVIFEGITGTSYTGDIAIDDVEIIDGACPLPGEPIVLDRMWLAFVLQKYFRKRCLIVLLLASILPRRLVYMKRQISPYSRILKCAQPLYSRPSTIDLLNLRICNMDASLLLTLLLVLDKHPYSEALYIQLTQLTEIHKVAIITKEQTRYRTSKI